MKEDRVITPTNQVRLTNVSVVRLNRAGKRFELACYKNKIVNYRQGIETDLTEVLQTTRIFTNVSKGEFAPAASLQKAFNTTDEDKICNWILDKGEIQVSNLERSAQLENKGLEIANMISEKCVNTMSQRRFTTQAIRDAMKEAEFCVHARKDVKQQFLDCVKLLKDKEVLPIERAKMRLAIIAATSNHSEESISQIMHKLNEMEDVKEIKMSAQQGHDNPTQLSFLADPSLYRVIDKMVKQFTKEEQNGQKWRLEIVQQCVFQEGDVNLESEMERKEQLLAMQQKSTNNTKQDDDIIADVDVISLAKELETSANITEENNKTQKSKKGNKKDDDNNYHKEDEDDDDEDEDEEYGFQRTTDRKKLKKQQKKSKKAKRRGMEEEEERLERQRKEQERQSQREKKEKKRQAAAKKAAASNNDADSNLVCAPLPPSQTTVSMSTTTMPTPVSAETSNSGEATKSCNTCGGSFTLTEYRAHFRSEWHRHNLKLKMKGLPTVTEKQYKKRDGEIYIE